MRFSIKPEIDEKLQELKGQPDEFFLSPEFWAFAYQTCSTYNDWEILQIVQSWIKKSAEQIPIETIHSFYLNWKLPNNPDPRLPSRSLAKTNPNMFERVKNKLKRNGEGTHCWACGISVAESKDLLANNAHIGLAAHEFWHWDDVSLVRQLIDIRFLCFECHYLTGQEAIWTLRARTREKDIHRIKKFCLVNQCNVPEMWAQMTHAMIKKRQISKTDPASWKMDYSPFIKLRPNLVRTQQRE